jgi:hypothetical protein
MNKNQRDFIRQVRETCKPLGVKLYFGKGKRLRTESILLNGFFSDDKKILAVATKKPVTKWLEILVHEYGHLIQYKNQTKRWKEINDDVWEWLYYKGDFSEKKIEKSIESTSYMELECEQIAVKTLRQFDLGIDIDSYIKRANSYLLFYQCLKYTRKWYGSGKAPYEIKEIYEKMPNKLIIDFDKSYSKYRPLYIEHYCP